MRIAFHKASQFNADIGLWDVSSVTDMRFREFEFMGSSSCAILLFVITLAAYVICIYCTRSVWVCFQIQHRHKALGCVKSDNNVWKWVQIRVSSCVLRKGVLHLAPLFWCPVRNLLLLNLSTHSITHFLLYLNSHKVFSQRHLWPFKWESSGWQQR